MFRSTSPAEVAIPAAAPDPPTVDEVHNAALYASANTRMIFTDLIEDLLEANARFDDVEMRTTAEIDRLTLLRDDAARQRRRNQQTIANLQGLVGQE